MRAVPVTTALFGDRGRGPSLERFLHDDELLLPGSSEGYAPSAGHICGAAYEGRWVVFHGLQVIQVVPDEVHTHWHLEHASDELEQTGVWRIEDSPWRASFKPRHLAKHEHFVLAWYDDVVEVICRDLIFGEGPFAIERILPYEPRLSYAYLRHAISQEKLGNVGAAIESYERYVKVATDQSSVDYAARCLASLRARGILT